MFNARLHLFFLCAVLQFSGCSSVQPIASGDSVSEKITSEQTPKQLADVTIEEEWKRTYEVSSAELERNRRLWQESKIVSYDFVIAKYMGGTSSPWIRLPVLIKVRDNRQTAIEKVEKDKDYVIFSRIDGFEEIDTIDKLFDYMRRRLDGGELVEAKYDKKIGYPKIIHFRFSYANVHGSQSLVVSKFEIIK